MKKVLIITYLFAQKEAVGAIRLYGLAKFLPDFGWEPTILTVKSPTKQSSHLKVIETSYDDLSIKWKKRLGLKLDKPLKEMAGLPTYKNKQTTADIILNLWEEIFAYPDANKGWYKFAIDAGGKLLEKESFDAIISSSSPVTSHFIAKELREKYEIPWIADLRDLWTQNHYYHYSSYRKFIERRLEVRTLSLAGALTTVSQPLAEKLKELHKGKKIYAITNGFDPDEKNIRATLSDKFNITYTGYLYKGKRDPEPLFKALQKLISDGSIEPDDIEVDFYGYTEGWLEIDIHKYGLQNVVKAHGLIPRGEAIKKQREAQLLLLLTWNDPKEVGVYTGKIFDYLSAQRPILSIGISGGVVEELLTKTSAGIHASTQEEIEDVLRKFYYEFKLKGKVGYSGINSEIEKYSQKEMARKFAEVLNDITSNKSINKLPQPQF